MLQIYCGDGKGKTTAAVGLAVRAAGSGMSVGFIQFMKSGVSSEIAILEKIPGIDVKCCDRDYGFFENMTDDGKKDITACHNALLRYAFSQSSDMIILDEFNFAYKNDLIDREAARSLIIDGAGNAEVILTGRNPDEIFLSSADYISEIKCIKHPYRKGVISRKGIEY